MAVCDGGPAFPTSPEESRGKVSSVHGGMTLRDYFAGRAMAQIECPLFVEVIDFDTPQDRRRVQIDWSRFNADDVARVAKETARFAYCIADAMLAEREQKP